jgi:hypothetical protein
VGVGGIELLELFAVTVVVVGIVERASLAAAMVLAIGLALAVLVVVAVVDVAVLEDEVRYPDRRFLALTLLPALQQRVAPNSKISHTLRASIGVARRSAWQCAATPSSTAAVTSLVLAWYRIYNVHSGSEKGQ